MFNNPFGLLNPMQSGFQLTPEDFMRAGNVIAPGSPPAGMTGYAMGGAQSQVPPQPALNVPAAPVANVEDTNINLTPQKPFWEKVNDPLFRDEASTRLAGMMSPPSLDHLTGQDGMFGGPGGMAQKMLEAQPTAQGPTAPAAKVGGSRSGNPHSRFGVNPTPPKVSIPSFTDFMRPK